MTKFNLFALPIAFITLSVANVLAQNISNAEKLFTLADDFKNKSQPDSAIFYYEKSAMEFISLDNTEKYIDAYNQIGILLTRQNKYDKAHEYLGKALQAGLSTDSNSLSTATTYISLGVLYGAEDHFDQSLINHNKALSIRISKLGKYNAEVATSYGNIGNIYLRKKDYDKSVDAHLQAKKIREKIFGKKSAEIIQTYTGLGNAYREKKNYKKSLQYFEKSLDNKILQTGKDNKDLAKYYKNISEVYYLMEDKENGDSYKLKSEEIGKKS